MRPSAVWYARIGSRFPCLRSTGQKPMTSRYADSRSIFITSSIRIDGRPVALRAAFGKSSMLTASSPPSSASGCPSSTVTYGATRPAAFTACSTDDTTSRTSPDGSTTAYRWPIAFYRSSVMVRMNDDERYLSLSS